MQCLRYVVNVIFLILEITLLGSGEYIIREMLARSLCESILKSPETDTHEVLHQHLSQFQSMCSVLMESHRRPLYSFASKSELELEANLNQSPVCY